MILPPVAQRRLIDRDLADFFRSHRNSLFNRAISRMCRFYNLRRPRISWCEQIDWGKTAGKTYEDGRILLVHPENWKRGRIHNRERVWVQMIYHEMGHYVLWSDPERKADMFMRRMVRGLRAIRASLRQRNGSQKRGRRVLAAAQPRGQRRTRRKRAA